MADDLAFVVIVERGPLERQTLLLVESIRAFAGPFRGAPVWAVQPRPGAPPSRPVLDRLARHDVVFIRADLNRVWRDYPLANKPSAAAFVEERVDGSVATLVLLDSDTLVLRPPRELVLRGRERLAVRPVDRRLIGSAAADPIPTFWDHLYRECGVDPARVWEVTATLDRTRLRAYFNTGLIAARPEARLFRRWHENLERMKHRVGDAGRAHSPAERWFLEQACFAATVLAHTGREHVRLLDDDYNYPVHHHAELPMQHRLGALEHAAVVHYHRAFYGTSWWRGIRVGEPYAAWLRSRLPLPGLRARFKQWPALRAALARVRAFPAAASALRARRL